MLTTARILEANDSDLEQYRAMKVMKRYEIMSTFQVESEKAILEKMESRGLEVGEQVCIWGKSTRERESGCMV